MYLANSLKNDPIKLASMKQQVQNNAGGLSFDAGTINQFQRFLFLGCEKGTCYNSEKQLLVSNVTCLQKIVSSEELTCKALALIENIHHNNRCAKPDTIIFSLAFLF